MEKCKYCNQDAKYQLKSGDWCCCKSPNSCPTNRNKNSLKLTEKHKNSPEAWIGKSTGCHGMASKEWRDANPDEAKKAYQKAGETLKNRIKNGEIIPIWKGKHLPVEIREKISQSASGGNCGFIKTKYYKIFCPYENKEVNVQGTWEYKYCKYLNENQINWVRSRKINLRFRYFDGDIKRTYYPDFYLPDENLYVEIKGYFSDNDKLKMEKVREYNKEKNILILQKKRVGRFKYRFTCRNC